MKQELGWIVGLIQPDILIDVTKPLPDDEKQTAENELAVFKDGPITGALLEAVGKLPAGTRLDGHLWTTGDKIYGRYFQAHLPGGRTVPICLELWNGGLGSDKQEGSKPGHAVTYKLSNTAVVEEWR
jgi:serine/threonine-protein kinase